MGHELHKGSTMALKLFQAKKTDLIGLDVGSKAVKLIRLKNTAGGYCVTAAGIADIQQAGEADESERDGKSVEAAIRRCLAAAQVRERYTVSGVAGSEVMVRGFKFPPMPPEAVEQAVLLEAQSVCPLEMKNSVLDYQLVGTAQDVQKDADPLRPRCGLMAAAAERLVRQRSQQLTTAGLKPVLMDVEALALLNCLNALNLVESRVTPAIIDLGYSTTNIIIYGQNGLPFVRDLNIAAGSMLRQICKEQAADEDLVHGVLCGMETTCTRETRNGILLSMNNAMRPLVSMLNETLRFYAMHEKNAVGKIFLCGGFSLVSTFAEMLTDALPIETVHLNPMDHLEWDTPAAQSELKTCGPALAVATGLAMRTL
jgi:type IV pilus assembly protein PilM